ncbi:HD domain-containing phosphohydrolase [Maridesulfovibrio sp.]|uniref:HD domain-containing phosphohydrolase n=1 Tax=Maridesulfovibrio sp. TaxID=2795000 RepID=UPI0029CA747E|nr:HD domain-containing phosphohydrolase [Maridesulfovibrio sp.]
MDYSETISVDLRQMVLAIENAVSLVGMNDTNHGKRVGYIALQMAKALNFSDENLFFIYELGLLHDCGVSSDTVHSYLANLFDWEQSGLHCRIGHDLLAYFEPLKKMAIPILYHHTPWEELQHAETTIFDKRVANLIFIADRIDITAAPYYEKNILLHIETIKKSIAEKSNTYFNPEFVKTFLDISQAEAFWLSLEDRHIEKFAWEMGSLESTKIISLADLKQLAKIFSYIIDQKSSFTVQHSYGVANLSRHIAIKYGLPDIVVDKIEIAAYLHDIGKLHIPDNILEKKGPLSPTERAIINQHSYETFEILRPVTGLEEIALWAAYHHENDIGTGYPFHPEKGKIPLPARIIAVADVFQALLQDRPYRKGMSLEQSLSILTKMKNESRLDSTIVSLVEDDALKCRELAKKQLSIQELLK